MKTLAACGLVILFTAGAFAQRINNSRGTNSGFGSVVFPAGRPTTGQPFTLQQSPNFANVMGNIIAGRPAYQGLRTGQHGGVNRGGNVIYVPSVYPVGGGYGYGYGYSGYSGYGDAPPQQQPNVTVVYPPQQPTPVIIMGTPGGQPGDVPHSSIQDYSQPQGTTAASDTSSAQPDASYYLLAFKDHSIYSAVGYWVDSDTLHYITGGNVHNQVSLSLVDRDLTAQLNKGRGVQIALPPAPSR